MLTVAAACDKNGAGRLLAARPNVLFQVVGSIEDPRVVPIAFLDSAGPRSIDFSPAEWRQFDSTYFRGGDSLTVYTQGEVIGSARVQRGMWDGGRPLYTLPGCASPLPQASVRVAADTPIGSLVEFFATSSPLADAAAREGRPIGVGPTQVAGLARTLAAREAEAADIPVAVLDSLDYRALAANTGSTRGPTVITQYVDPSGGGEGGREDVRHIFLVADQVDSGWVVTYRNVQEDAGRSDPLRRYVDRLDLTGDGVAELLLEEWTLGGGSRPVVLRWNGRAWDELWRGRADWCLETE